MDDLKARLEFGRQKYGHGVRVLMDTTTWGTPKNSWLEMAKEEFLDAVIYVTSDYIRNYIDICELKNEDQNELILHCIETRKYTMIKSLKHKQMIDNLIIMINQC
tara:strand:- start:415 stop:729 length:315 start_codon:yes stop_codon:yes gene_type:complete